jgi:hypothetical protein
MFTIEKPKRAWSEIGIRVLIGSVIASVLLALFDGISKGLLRQALSEYEGRWVMLSTWIVDFRYLADQAVYAATIFIVGAKFIEMRTVFTVGFDKLDAAKIVIKGPDDDNVVWVGHRYGTRFEAEAVAETFAERLKQSAI